MEWHDWKRWLSIGSGTIDLKTGGNDELVLNAQSNTTSRIVLLLQTLFFYADTELI